MLVARRVRFGAEGRAPPWLSRGRAGAGGLQRRAGAGGAAGGGSILDNLVGWFQASENIC